MESEVIIDSALALVSFEQAESLQKLGFNYKTINAYCLYPASKDSSGWGMTSKPTGYGVDWNDKEHYGLNDANGWSHISAPSVALALKWLREKKDLDVTIRATIMGNGKKKYDMDYLYGNIRDSDSGIYDSYEEAESRGLGELLKYLLKR